MNNSAWVSNHFGTEYTHSVISAKAGIQSSYNEGIMYDLSYREEGGN